LSSVVYSNPDAASGFTIKVTRKRTSHPDIEMCVREVYIGDARIDKILLASTPDLRYDTGRGFLIHIRICGWCALTRTKVGSRVSLG
jgi:hypothetical protein